jgi:hypothetical protein
MIRVKSDLGEGVAIKLVGVALATLRQSAAASSKAKTAAAKCE